MHCADFIGHCTCSYGYLLPIAPMKKTGVAGGKAQGLELIFMYLFDV